MKCPHCLVEFHEDMDRVWLWNGLRHDKAGIHGVNYCQCPRCGKVVLFIAGEGGRSLVMIWPKGTARSALPPVVDEKFAADYREACDVLAESPKASAALSRCCLQMLLREKGGVKKGDLNSEIEQILNSKSLGSNLAAAIDAIRVIGNFAAHPMKSTNTGEIIDVEPGEAEWLLDTLEKLFDFYFVEPNRLAKNRDELNAKLKDSGKPPLK